MFAESLLSSAYQSLFRIIKLVASTLPAALVPSPPGPPPSGYLSITDTRTNLQYEIPIHRNAVEAIRFKEIRAPKDHHHPADKVSAFSGPLPIGPSFHRS